jgi:hypothetical protein
MGLEHSRAQNTSQRAKKREANQRLLISVFAPSVARLQIGGPGRLWSAGARIDRRVTSDRMVNAPVPGSGMGRQDSGSKNCLVFSRGRQASLDCQPLVLM